MPTELEIGYALGREFWGQGYATEAATAVRNHALRSMHRDPTHRVHQAGQPASARVAEKLGMRHERDVELMELPRSALRARERARAIELAFELPPEDSFEPVEIAISASRSTPVSTPSPSSM